jgi:hypothetical protein
MIQFTKNAWFGGVGVAIFMLAAMLATLSPARAAEPDQVAVAPPPSHFEPAAPGADLLSPNLLKIPHAASVPDKGKFEARNAQKDQPDMKIPDTIDLGKSLLRFDASRSAISSGPRVGIDGLDPSVLNPGIPVRKDSPLTPSYFGLTLSTPIH